jgi:hypothetical protein
METFVGGNSLNCRLQGRKRRACQFSENVFRILFLNEKIIGVLSGHESDGRLAVVQKGTDLPVLHSFTKTTDIFPKGTECGAVT